MEQKNVIKINGPVIEASGNADFAMHDLVYVGSNKLMGEVIKIDGNTAIIQCYEDTSGMKIGEEVVSTNGPLELTLGPGMIGNVYDGIQRPLKILEEKTGPFIQKGINVSGINEKKKWHFVPSIVLGESVKYNSIIGTVKETESISIKIMYPYQETGTVIEILKEGDYTVNEVVAKVKLENGKITEITMKINGQ